MRNFSHWSPRYLKDRLEWFLYERRNMDHPWLTPTANDILSTLIVPSDEGLEWGSGRSTLWLARRMRRLTSVEHSPDWYTKITAKLREDGLGNVTYLLKQADGCHDATLSEYVSVCESFRDGGISFALVDGQLRDHCANAVVDKLAPGGLLVVDNVNWYLDRPTKSPSSRTGLGPSSDGWASFERRVAKWRMIWTSSGVTDTAIWIKPPC